MPTSGHRVYSEPFQGWKKTYLSNVPIKAPKTANRTPVYEIKADWARNRGNVMLSGIQLVNAGAISVNNEPSPEDSMPLSSEAQSTIVTTKEALRGQSNYLLEGNNKLRAQESTTAHGILEQNSK